MPIPRCTLFLALLILVFGNAYGQSDPGSDLTLINAFPNLSFNQPLLLTHAGDSSDRVFVVEKPGFIHVFDNNEDVTSTQLFLDISDKILPPGHRDLGETGLLSLAFHPDYGSNGLLYISYVDENLVSIVSELQISDDPNIADKESERILLSMQQPQRNHNGGHIAFGLDGYLYIAFGDGFSESSRDGIDSGDPLGHGQNLETWFSSMLRIDIDNQQDDLEYSIPSDNPFVGNQEGWLEEIYAYGFRNPWRFSFDREEGTLWLADVGDKKAEEVNHIESGDNYGWSLKEASHCFEDVPCDTTLWVDLTDPVFEYLRDVGESVTGGYVYRGTTFPELQGTYIFGDFDFGTVWALSAADDSTFISETLIPDAGFISSFGEDEAGEIYIVDFGGDIWTFEEPSRTSVEVPPDIPGPFTLIQNYPNPFSRATQLLFDVSEPGTFTLQIYDVTGRTVRTITKLYSTSGQYSIEWDGKDDSGKDVASGIYMSVLEAGGFQASQKMVLAR